MQALDQRELQQDRYGPQLAERQRIDALVGHHHAPERVDVDAAVAVRDDGQRQVIDARQPAAGTVGEPRQLGAVVLRQVAARDADLLLDQVVVVEQPFAGRRDAALLVELAGEQRMPGGERRGVVLQPRDQPVLRAPALDDVVACQRLGVGFELFGAVQLGAQGQFGIRRRTFDPALLQPLREHGSDHSPRLPVVPVTERHRRKAKTGCGAARFRSVAAS